jgi:hypothetical protein
VGTAAAVGWKKTCEITAKTVEYTTEKVSQYTHSHASGEGSEGTAESIIGNPVAESK